jgi:subtilisin family serine protease
MKISRLFNAIMALFLIAAALSTVQPAAAQKDSQPRFQMPEDALYVPGEVIVGFNPGKSAKAYAAQASALAGEVSAQVAQTNGSTALLSFAEDADVESLVAQLADSEGVAYAEPNYIAWIPEAFATGASSNVSRTAATTVDRPTASGDVVAVEKSALSSLRRKVGSQSVPAYPPEYTGTATLPDGADLWGWDQINADTIWPNTVVSPMVCVLDTGVDDLHPDLKGKVTKGKDFVNDDLVPNDDNGHGTHVAGVISALNSNKVGIVGVSNGTILAVKVLNSQGSGNVYDIAAGIDACAANATVRVINMSLGFPADSAVVFTALQNAIVTKGKFVVAAAGNESTSAYAFPAAWAADFVCANGDGDASSGACLSNTIHQGLISVGAGYAPDTLTYDALGDGNGRLWVDTDDGVSGVTFGDDELADAAPISTCLTDFSNYGAWVNIVAPGDGILSTVPVSYPFNDQNDLQGEDGGLGIGYAYMSGTSMAAPFVSGAAARMLSVYPLLKNVPFAVPGIGTVADGITIKSRLIDTGVSLFDSLASDINAIDPTIGYTDLDTNGVTGEIPYCIPVDNTVDLGNYGPDQDMSAATYLDAAAAMDRTAIRAFVRDASNGLPLSGATVVAMQGTTIKDTAIVSGTGTDGLVTSGVVELINLPVHVTPPPALPAMPAQVKYMVKVTKTGYTTGAIIGSITPTISFDTNEQLVVSVPPTGTGKIHFVTEWGTPEDTGIDFDLYTFLPQEAGQDIIGNSSEDYDDTYNLTGRVNLTSPISEGILSTLYMDKTRWNFNGGIYGAGYLGTGAESVTMMTGTLTTAPFYNSTAYNAANQYQFFATDYGESEYDGKFVVRLWRAGLPVSNEPAADGVAGPYPLATAAPYVYTIHTVNPDDALDLYCDDNLDGTNFDGDGTIGTSVNNADNEWIKLGHMWKNFFFVAGTAIPEIDGLPVTNQFAAECGLPNDGAGGVLPYAETFNNKATFR